MKRWFVSKLFMLVMLAMAAQLAQAEVANRLVAIVNHEVITLHQWDKAVMRARRQLKAQGQDVPEESSFRRSILQQLIDQKIQLQMVEHNHITVTQRQIDQAITHMRQAQGQTPEQFAQHLQAMGYSLEAYRQQMRDFIAINMLQHQMLADKVHVDAQALKELSEKIDADPNYAWQYKVHDVHIPFQGRSPAQVEHVAQQIMQTWRQSPKLMRVAGYPVNAMGWQSTVALPDQFTVVLRRLKDDEISQPIKANNGYHVLQRLAALPPAHQPPNAAMRYNMLAEQQLQKAVAHWQATLRQQSYIKLLVG